jgi:hypothetical protein
MHNEEIRGLVRLSGRRDLQVAAGDPDLRGWKMLAGDGCSMGTVTDMLVDLAAMKVAFVEVLVDAAKMGRQARDDHRVLIAARDVRLPDPETLLYVSGGVAIADSLTSARFAALPRFDDAAPAPGRRVSLGRGTRLVGAPRSADLPARPGMRPPFSG